MRNTIDNITRGLSNIELRDTLDCVVMTLLDTQNRIRETKDFINNAMELKRRKENKFIEMNNEMLEVLRLEEEAKAKIRALKMKMVSNE
ncbi:hypothetical protein JJB67_14235 [Clostridium perfringens]|uniref:hypothetical protein n=1 Tax=Clostridium perfringens TaxID=1502 RepID=UPI000D714AD0|nr:hypothetical protein [Clostridium perfringens]MBO3323477.1 hypothetical protein [Clostridium perfringens]MBO3332612.1 hypothetical protein [Clostridium perfringens]PWW98114.1 hypothetical protein CYK75_13920 [Clostridium perfringens]